MENYLSESAGKAPDDICALPEPVEIIRRIEPSTERGGYVYRVTVPLNNGLVS
jgi:hypothetical protein